jgi:hypothetical protein
MPLWRKFLLTLQCIDEDNTTAIRLLRFVAFYSEKVLGWDWIATDTLLKLTFFKSYA